MQDTTTTLGIALNKMIESRVLAILPPKVRMLSGPTIEEVTGYDYAPGPLAIEASTKPLVEDAEWVQKMQAIHAVMAKVAPTVEFGDAPVSDETRNNVEQFYVPEEGTEFHDIFVGVRNQLAKEQGVSDYPLRVFIDKSRFYIVYTDKHLGYLMGCIADEILS